jgi:hypothetical protein
MDIGHLGLLVVRENPLWFYYCRMIKLGPGGDRPMELLLYISTRGVAGDDVSVAQNLLRMVYT